MCSVKSRSTLGMHIMCGVIMIRVKVQGVRGISVRI